MSEVEKGFYGQAKAYTMEWTLNVNGMEIKV